MSNNSEKEKLLKKHVSAILIAVVMIVGLLTIIYISLYFDDPEYFGRENDLPNYVTLIAEIMIGFIIAIAVHKISSNSQKRINQAVANIENMVWEEHEDRQEHKLELKYRLMGALESMHDLCKNIKNKYDLYDENSPNEEESWKEFNKLVSKLRDISETQIDSRIKDFERYFIDGKIDELKKISTLTKNGSTFKFLNRAQSGPDVSELLIVLPMQIDFIKKDVQ